MTSSARFLTLTLLSSCLLAHGCVQVAESLVELSRLQAAIAKEYGEEGVNVNLNNSSFLVVTFINSSLNARSEDDRKKRAAETAAFVSRHYPSIAEIEEIWVGFVRQQTRYVVVHYSEGLGFFGFDKRGQPLSTPEERQPARDPDGPRAIAVYSPASDETEVRIASLQLAGDVNQGLSVAPHFTVPGDATGVRRSSSSPRSVSFDFGSYSTKSLFPGEPQITFLADGKVAYETSAQFSTSKNPDNELFSEFLMLQVPYPAFRRMTAGKELTLKLGDHEYKLTDEQLKALREMTEYVRD